ncbi:MAG: site-2 protease family protein [Candidatus Baltobacteraceae bacterium]
MPQTPSWAERPEDKQYDVVPGDGPPQSGAVSAANRAKGFGAVLLAIGAAFAKFKLLLVFLLNLKFAVVALKVFWFAGSFLASVWFYALFWGLKFALGFVLLIGIHEFGHWFVMKFYGVPASLPFFIPGMGALVNMRGTPPSAYHESLIAFAGPATGAFASSLCAWIGFSAHDPFWIALAYTGLFLNLFNLAPVMPLDGGRIVGSISPRIWIAGLVLFVAAMIAFHLWNPLIIVLIVLSLPQVIRAWKGTLDAGYYGISVAQRITVTALYFGLAAVLFGGMLYTHVPVARHVIAQ